MVGVGRHSADDDPARGERRWYDAAAGNADEPTLDRGAAPAAADEATTDRRSLAATPASYPTGDAPTVRRADLPAQLRTAPPALPPIPGNRPTGVPPASAPAGHPAAAPTPAPTEQVTPAPAYWPTVPTASRASLPSAALPEQPAPPAGDHDRLFAHWAAGDTRERSPRAGARGPSRGRSLGSWIVVVVVAVLVAAGLRLFVVESFWIPSGSMEPTLHGCSGCNNDRVLVNKLSYRVHGIDRGDVVVFDKPVGVEDPDKYLIKRVIGLPGETVSGHDGRVWIGNRPLTEPYRNTDCGPQDNFAPTTVPDGKVFLMGDNRCDSYDSRIFGPVAENEVVGRAFMIVWPVARRHWL